jgi:hypothetical protein
MTTSVTVNGFEYRPLRNGATGMGGRHSKASTRGNCDVGTYGGAPRALWGFERRGRGLREKPIARNLRTGGCGSALNFARQFPTAESRVPRNTAVDSTHSAATPHDARCAAVSFQRRSRALPTLPYRGPQ